MLPKDVTDVRSYQIIEAVDNHYTYNIASSPNSKQFGGQTHSYIPDIGCATIKSGLVPLQRIVYYTHSRFV